MAKRKAARRRKPARQAREGVARRPARPAAKRATKHGHSARRPQQKGQQKRRAASCTATGGKADSRKAAGRKPRRRRQHARARLGQRRSRQGAAARTRRRAWAIDETARSTPALLTRHGQSRLGCATGRAEIAEASARAATEWTASPRGDPTSTSTTRTSPARKTPGGDNSHARPGHRRGHRQGAGRDATTTTRS